MIEVQQLTKSYGRFTAIQSISFQVNHGEILGFLGPNGAGKTTTMRVLTGYHPATSGTATIAGFDVHQAPLAVKKNTGYLPENVPLYLEMPVHRYLRYVAEIKGIEKGKRTSEIDRVLDRCGLTEMSKRIIRNLSKGFRQRVGLAQALLGDPPVLILDEPTVGLDPRQIITIRKVIKELAQDHTVLLSTHILPEVSMLCDRVVILNQGTIVAEDSLSNLANESVTTLRASGNSNEVLKILRTIKGVSAATETGPGHFRISTEKGLELTSEMTQKLVQAEIKVEAIAPGSRTLEDVFIEAIDADKDSAA
jgi:ABC-2 type transport system ATP-binding protein